MAAQQPTSRNVDALIEKLRADGVDAGRQEADRLRSEAEAHAVEIVAAAQAEADALRAKARKEAQHFREAGEEALEIAMRDAIMTMRSDLIAQLEADVQRMVTVATADPEFLKRMILELVGAVRDQANVGENTAIGVPTNILRDAPPRDAAEMTSQDPLSRFALGLAQDMLKKGVVFFADDDLGVGIRARVDDKDLTIDLTDEAVAALLMRHLQPRFRAILDGVIR